MIRTLLVTGLVTCFLSTTQAMHSTSNQHSTEFQTEVVEILQAADSRLRIEMPKLSLPIKTIRFEVSQGKIPTEYLFCGKDDGRFIGIQFTFFVSYNNTAKDANLEIILTRKIIEPIIQEIIHNNIAKRGILYSCLVFPERSLIFMGTD